MRRAGGSSLETRALCFTTGALLLPECCAPKSRLAGESLVRWQDHRLRRRLHIRCFSVLVLLLRLLFAARRARNELERKIMHKICAQTSERNKCLRSLVAFARCFSRATGRSNDERNCLMSLSAAKRQKKKDETKVATTMTETIVLH